MTDFFANLERELRGAAVRRPRRVPPVRSVVGKVLATGVALAALAVALAVPALVLFGSGDKRVETSEQPILPSVGTVIRKGEGVPPREEDSTVVATGRTRIAGPWQIESYRGAGLKDPQTGEEYEPAGLRCLRLVLTRPPRGAAAASGACGEFPKTPGFSRLQTTVSSTRAGNATDPETTEILVYGRVPERALGVDLRIPGRLPERFQTFEGPRGTRGDYYLITVSPESKNARVDWMAPDGGGRGGSIALLPP